MPLVGERNGKTHRGTLREAEDFGVSIGNHY
jgi:hypothetical protein